MDKNRYCIIMAGGIGSRFWPYSRVKKPKQFLDILGTGETLLQQTFNRFSDICPEENILIVTNSDYKDIVLKQLPQLEPSNILLEPLRKNTAPCIAYANYKIIKRNPEATIVVAPSDHYIQKEKEFKVRITEGLDFVKDKNALLTLGIKPNRPKTGYGYIQISKKETPDRNANLKKVKTFTEKPDYKLAKEFFESGEFYWNSGIFIWSLRSIMEAFKKHLPEVDSVFNEGSELFDGKKEKKIILKIYSKCKRISIDYGIMEKAENVYVLCSDFGWSDLGTWSSLYENLKKDENNNVLTGNKVFDYEVSNSVVRIKKNKLAVLQGLDDFIVIDTNDVLLICRKKDEQKIKQYVNEVKLNKGDKFI